MKKRVFLSLVLAAVLVGLVLVGPDYVQAQTPIKLKYSNFFPPTHAFSVLASQFCDEAKKEDKRQGRDQLLSRGFPYHRTKNV